MKNISQEQLNEKMRLHGLWLGNKEGGVRANLRGADLSWEDLSGADLFKVDFFKANLYKANLLGANLHAANLFGANLFGANLRGANLRGANFFKANLTDTDLSDADLTGANLVGTNLVGTNFTNTILSNSSFSETIKAAPNAKTHLFQKDGGRKCFAIPAFAGKSAIVWIVAGCFRGTLDKFEERAKETYPHDPIEAYASEIAELREIFKAH